MSKFEYDPFAIPLRIRLNIALRDAWDYLVALRNAGGCWWYIERCLLCERFNIIGRSIKVRRLNTCYADDERNYVLSCKPCYTREVEQYDELWQEYYHHTGVY